MSRRISHIFVYWRLKFEFERTVTKVYKIKPSKSPLYTKLRVLFQVDLGEIIYQGHDKN